MLSLVYFAKVINISRKELWDVMKDDIVIFVDLLRDFHVVGWITALIHQSELCF